jgi:hypothetical protein
LERQKESGINQWKSMVEKIDVKMYADIHTYSSKNVTITKILSFYNETFHRL